jgi:succinate dehydrogenase / fumarate reductase cytochrome b subunit
MTAKIKKLPRHFVWRRLHSMTGLWLVIFLVEHMVTNSQAALLLGDSGKGFVHMVNALHNLPYLTVIEVGLLGIPILIHAFWGIQYAMTSKFNSMRTSGSKPHLKYARNKAYTWQRITSWILLVLLALHIVKFRFLDYPKSVNTGTQNPSYLVEITMDPGLYTIAHRLGFTLYDHKALDKLRGELGEMGDQGAVLSLVGELEHLDGGKFNPQEWAILQTAQTYEQRRLFIEKITNIPIKKGEVIAVTPSFGTASLLNVRNTFKSPVWVGIYTIFVLSAVFHAFNGLWTSMLTWGWIIKVVAQTRARKVAITLMIAIAFLGLAAVWGTYFLNLRN